LCEIRTPANFSILSKSLMNPNFLIYSIIKNKIKFEILKILERGREREKKQSNRVDKKLITPENRIFFKSSIWWNWSVTRDFF
jgi:hypothetical protein